MKKISNYLLQGVMGFITSKPVIALRDGLLYTMPASLVGAMFLLFANVPIEGYTDFMANIFGIAWDKAIYQVVNSTLHMGALLGVFGIAYTYTQNEGYSGVSAGIIGIVSFLILNNHFVTYEGVLVSGALSTRFLGGQGIIGSILLGLFVGFMYSWCMKKNLKIVLPEAVPPGVANAFSSILPFFIITVCITIFYTIFDKVFQKTPLEIIYEVLQTPMQYLGSSLAGAILIPLLISLLWWCGIHGPLVVMGIMGPILGANGLANQQLRDQGVELIAGENAFIVTGQVIDQFVTVSGSGFTLGLVISMVLFAKSSHFKQLGKLALVPGLFNINEPIIFGMPIVFNPFMLIPFICAPVASGVLVFFAIQSGFLEPFGAVAVPWTTPIIISGFLVGGWKAALLQLITTIMTTCIYLPFFKLQDKIAYKKEEDQSKEEIKQ